MSLSPTRNVPRRVLASGPIGLVLFFIATVTVLFLFEPGRYTFYPRCLFHQTTGLLCPGCGSLRAAHQLLHGHVVAAFRLNALFVLSLPAAAWLLARWFVRARIKRVQPLDFHPVWFWAVLVIGVLFGILRNLPFAHAAWLAA